jgi:alpha-L-fucosidase
MKKITAFLLIILFCSSMMFSQTKMTQDERMQWWRDARFGLFIHWGLYAIPAGEWEGKEIPGIGEWIMKRAQIPVEKYRDLANRFNPVKFNAHDFVMTAKNAGMKYIVITSKHHDGFAMFKSEASKYNIVDATPYGKDIIKQLADECNKQGLKICFYYSQSRDWNEPNGLDNDWDFQKERDFQKYLDEKVKPQLTELLTNYGPIGLIWFDTPMTISQEQAQSLKDLVRKLQPACIISGRLGGGVQTDYISTGDNVIPGNVDRSDWEVPATLNDTWGFKKNDHNWKSSKDLTQLLFGIVSKGGNYLLNVGPDAEGKIPEASVKILAEVGNWMKINSEAIYGTKASPFQTEFNWGCVTQKDNKLYLGIFDWEKGDFYLEGLENKVEKIYLLSDETKKALKFKQTFNKNINHHRLNFQLPDKAPDNAVSVVVIETNGIPKVEQGIYQQADRTITLSAFLATTSKNGKPEEIKSTSRGGGVDLTDKNIQFSWNFNVEKKGNYKIDIVTTETGSHGNPLWQGGHKVRIISGNQTKEIVIERDKDEYNPRTQYWKKIHTNGGVLKFHKPGQYKIELIPISISEGKSGFTFQEINLLPLK